jgi:rhodanese-related sulfurtransferase
MNKESIYKELEFKAVRSSGAGGQHVNKVSSKVELSFNIPNSESISNEEKELLLKNLSKRLTKEVDTLLSVSAETLEQKIHENALVFDVRKPGEYANEHIENTPSTPLDYLNDHIAEFPTDKDFYVHCAGGYRSVIAASILKARGYHKVIDVAGGYGAIKKTGIKRTDVVSCSSTK